MGINKNLKRNDISGKKVKNPDNAPNSIVIQNVDVRPIHRTKQDIPNWRRAIESAEAQTPRRKLLMELYHDVILDGHVIAVTSKRFDAVTGANWQFVNKDNEAVDVINDIIDSIGFETLTKEILNAKFWGYSILEPKFYKAHNENWEMTAGLIPRRHYIPEKGIVSYDAITEDGINIREGFYAKTVLEAGETTDLGLLAAAAQYYVLKRGGIGDYAMYVQVFGRPIIDATWDGQDETQRQKLREALDIGAGGTIIRPEGTNIDIIESKGNQSTVHEDFKNAMNTEISKALLGTTETTESSKSSGFAQSETHNNSDDKKFKSDITYVRKVLNSRFIKILEAHGFDTEGGKFVVEEIDATSDKEKIAIINNLTEKHNLPIDDDYLYKTFNVPKPEDYDAKKKEGREEKNNTNKPAEKKPAKEPENVEGKKSKSDPKPNTTKTSKKSKENEEEAEVKLIKKIKKKLTSFFLKAQAQTWATNGKHHTINLSNENGLNTNNLIQRVWDAEGKLEFDTELFKSTLKVLLKGFKKGWDAKLIKLNSELGFEYNFNDPALLTAFELNLFRFAGAKDLATIQQLNELFRQSNSFKEFKAKASKLIKIHNQNYLETEYNTAVLTGESAALYHRLKQQAEIFPYWEYVTAGDEHVRHSHKPLHGIVLPADDPRWSKLFPPNGWNCRCYVKPIMKHEFTGDFEKMRKRADNYLKSPAYAKEEAQGWGVNRGEIGKIFTSNQQYVNKFKNNSSSILNNLSAVKWGLHQYSNAKKIASKIAPAYNGTANDFYNGLKGDLHKEITDYNNRILKVEKNNFIRHSTNKKESRVKLLKAAEETLNNPDEVWLQGLKFSELIYLKYYEDKTMVIIGELNGLNLEFRSWFNLFEKKKIIEKYRKGLLVKNKS